MRDRDFSGSVPETAEPSQVSAVPEHVSESLVKTFDLYELPGMNVDPFATISKFHDGPRIFWADSSARYGHGHWVVTRAEDIREILTSPEIFSSNGWTQTQAITGAQWPLVPIELDGDDHLKFRPLIMSWFAGPALKRLDDSIRQRAVDLLANFETIGRCEFVSDFGRQFPVSIFLDLMGFPQEELEVFSVWVDNLLRITHLPTRVAAAESIISYLTEAANERRDNPGNDLTTKIVTAEIDGRPITEDETIGLLFTLFLAGLDTVVASLGLHFNHLARDKELQDRLRSDPGQIHRAVEEFLRLYSPVTTRRRATQDTEIAGVKIKKNDWVSISTSLGSLDPEKYECPRKFDSNRKHDRHFAFGAGPHVCLGRQLAEREINVAIEEWLKRIPGFRIPEGTDIPTRGGGVFGVEHLPLEWDPA